jgi:RecA/RadA recombinase
MARKKTSEIKEEILERKPVIQTDWGKSLSTGSTLLNLACTGNPDQGFLPGHYYILVGDSASGKSMACMTIFAEACKNPNFVDHRLIYDNVEDGVMFDIGRFFGQKAAERIEPPLVSKEGLPLNSKTIEDFYFNLDDAVRADRPFVYVLDSMDALSSVDELKSFQEAKKTVRKASEGEDVKLKGNYGDGKAKKNSAYLRSVMGSLSKSGSILILINQTRDNIGRDAQFNPKTKSGGNALTFYASLEIWLSIKERLSKEVNDRDRPIGIITKFRVKKNRLSGKDRTVLVPIYYSHGFDDTQSMVDFLVLEGHWKRFGSRVDARDFEYSGTVEQIVRHVEQNDLEDKLKKVVAEVWNEIEKKCSVERKKRYG